MWQNKFNYRIFYLPLLFIFRFMNRIIITLSFLFVFCICPAQEDIRQEIDSIYQTLPSLNDNDKLAAYTDMALILYYSHEQELQDKIYQEYISEARRQNNIRIEGQAREWQLQVCIGRGDNQTYDALYPATLHFLYKHQLWTRYFDVYKAKIDHDIMLNQLEDALENIIKMLHIAQKEEQAIGIGNAYLLLGNLNVIQKRFDEANDAYQVAIEQFKLINDSLSLWYAYERLSEALVAQERWEEVEVAFENMNALLDQWQDEDYYEYNTYALYIDMSHAYIKKGDFDRAEESLRFLESNYPKLIPQAQLIVLELRFQIELEQGYLKEALGKIDPLIEKNREYGEMQSVQYYLGEKIKLLCHFSADKDFFNTYNEYINLLDSARNIEVTRQLDELHVQYEVERYAQEKKRNQIYFYWALLVCALLLCIVLLGLLYQYKLKAKNQQLMHRLQEHDALHSLLKKQSIEIEQTSLSRKEAPQQSPVKIREQHSLFEILSSKMKEDKIFIDPMLNRKKLAEDLHTNEKQLSNIIMKETGLSFKDYINSYRLMYAKELITNSDSTVETIAAEAGFGSRSSFFQLFKAYTGMSPHEYRKHSCNTDI